MQCVQGFCPPQLSKLRNQKGYREVGDVEVLSHFPSNGETQLLMVPGDNGQNERSEPTESTEKKILNLAIPTLGALLIDPLLTLADTAFVGKFSNSPNELAGMGSAAALLTFSFYLFNFLCTATTPLVSAKRAAGKETEALAVGGQALSLALVLGASLMVILLSAKQPLLNIMGTGVSGPEANGFAIDFLTMRAVAAPAVFCISASTGILRGYLDTKTSVVILALANIINLALDIILIAYARMGPAGAAIATTTAEWISALLFLGVLSGNLPSADGELGRKGEDQEKTLVVMPTSSVPPWEELKPLIVASSSLFLRTFVLQFSISAAAALAARGGETLPGGAASSIGAHQIGLQLWLLCSFIADALAAASQALVADALGRDDDKEVRKVSKTVLGFSVLLGLILATLLQVGYSTNFLLSLFTSDPSTQAALAEILTLIVIAQPLNSVVFAADGILQGAAEFEFQAKSMALSAAIAAVCFGLLQSFSTSDTLVNVWTALITLQLMRGITSAVKIADKEGPIRMFTPSEI
eukprot:scaffold26019_cov147-Cylindrotheca_fusiformis.AAC.4